MPCINANPAPSPSHHSFRAPIYQIRSSFPQHSDPKFQLTNNESEMLENLQDNRVSIQIGSQIFYKMVSNMGLNSNIQGHALQFSRKKNVQLLTMEISFWTNNTMRLRQVAYLDHNLPHPCLIYMYLL